MCRFLNFFQKTAGPASSLNQLSIGGPEGNRTTDLVLIRDAL